MTNVNKWDGKKLELTAVMDGEIIKIEEVNDPVFSQKMIGDGYGLLPTGEKLYSPINGVVEEVASTKHAIYLSTDDRIKLLIHIGVNTIELKGQGFESKIEKGQAIKKGDLLVRFNPEKIRKLGFDPVVSVILLDQNNRKVDLTIFPNKQAIANETPAMLAELANEN